jgi:hypothetical protein
MAVDRTRLLQSLAIDRTALKGPHCAWQTWDMATPVLGARHPQWRGLCGACRLLPHQSGDARIRSTRDGVALFNLPLVRRTWRVSVELGGWAGIRYGCGRAGLRLMRRNTRIRYCALRAPTLVAVARPSNLPVPPSVSGTVQHSSLLSRSVFAESTLSTRHLNRARIE